MNQLHFRLITSLLLCGCEHAVRSPEKGAFYPKHTPIAHLQTPIFTPSDTLQVQGKVFRLLTVTRAVFDQLPAGVLPHRPDSVDSPSIIAARGRVQRQGPRLIFKLDNGHYTKVQDDTTDTDAATTHLYWGELAKAHQRVLFVGLWEGSQVLLIDQRTGHKTYAWGQPVASPDGKYLLSYSYDMAYDPTGLQLYSIGSSSLNQLWQHNTSWGPVAIRWLNNQAVIIEKQDVPTGESEHKNNSWIRLDLALPN